VPGASATAALFPGQGSSLEGSRRLVEETCPELYERCCLLVGEDPFERAGESTRYTQPATYLASMAGWSRAVAGGLRPAAFAGHSLGELSALAAAGVWSAERALELVVLRAALMADAGDGADEGMLALLRCSLEHAEELAERFGVTVANDNAPGQTVLSGPRERLRALATEARSEGQRAIELGVSGAFHSPAMEPAAAPLVAAVRAAPPAAASAPVYSCLTARPFSDPAAELGAALCSPVRWRGTVLSMRDAGIVSYLDIGPDRVLAGLVRRIDPEAEVSWMEEGVRAAA
jgi:malonyl CoA-acyl carrier protein transacylase